MNTNRRSLLLLALVLCLVVPQGVLAQTGSVTNYIPMLMNGEELPQYSAVPRINIPFFDSVIDSQREYTNMSVFWFGQVRSDSNYTDARVGYSATELAVLLNIFDRRLWYNESEDGSSLENWDAATLTLDLNGSSPTQQPTSQSFRFIAELRHWQTGTSYQAAYRGNGSGWSAQSIAFTPVVAPTAVPSPNDSIDDRGWTVTFRIPFSSLGLSEAPAEGTLWRMSIGVYDRDSQEGPPLPMTAWPSSNSLTSPATWGELRFGLPGYTPPASSLPSTVTIRQGVNGAVVPDAMVGGGTNCGEGLNYWTQWGEKNYAGAIDNVVQNQINLGDWPCFSKLYLTFPLDSLPDGKIIRSARLVLNNFGGSDPTQANTSIIQVLTVASSWEETAINWNNAPAFQENVIRLSVPVIPIGGPAAYREWDLSRAVAQAYGAGTSLNIALYSADASMHSGKYFRSSEFQDTLYRPTLIIEWGNP